MEEWLIIYDTPWRKLSFVPQKSSFQPLSAVNKSVYLTLKKAGQLIVLLSIIGGLVVQAATPVHRINEIQSLTCPSAENSRIHNVQKYNFSTLGIASLSLSWSGLGDFKTSINTTFDFNNKGPVLLLLEYSSKGEHPDTPGYIIAGTFNDQTFETTISRTLLPTKDNSHVVRQIAIPLLNKGRFLNNELELNITASNDFVRDATGSLIIRSSSSLQVGDALVIDSYGQFPLAPKPGNWEGETSIGGTKFYSCIQFTINNETLINKGEYTCALQLEKEGEIIVDLALIDIQENRLNFNINSTAESVFALVNFQPKIGINWYQVEVTVYGESIWSTDFNLAFEASSISIKEVPKGNGLGFGELEIPFFQWPSVPIVGFITLLLWFLPYSILKYREWKKVPGEVDFNNLDENMDILPPEGIAAEDDDVLDENFDFVE